MKKLLFAAALLAPLPAAGPTGVASVTALPVSSTTSKTTPGGSK